MKEQTNKTNRSFWIVFGILVTMAAVSTIVNLSEYRKMDRLQNQGTRVMTTIDSLKDKGSKKEVFVTFTAGDSQYVASKKVKTQVAKGDSVPVYFLPDEPEVNAIAIE